MVTKRIIPCLDIKDGRTVKGVNFVELRDAGDPVELAQRYSEEGADELVFLDITATKEKRKTLVDLVEKVARKVSIPFTVGGGISSVEDVNKLLRAGADKVVLPYEMGGRRIAAQVMYPSVTDFLETIMSTESLELRMAEIKVGGSSSLTGQSLLQSDIRKHTGVVILAIKSDGTRLVTNPPPDTIINARDTLICLGTQDQIQELQKLAGGAS